MTKAARAILLLGAALCGGFIFLLGSTTSLALEPDRLGPRTAIFWFAAGLLASLPLWLPAVVPNRFSITQKACRWVCALLLLFPTYLFGTIVSHNLSKSISILRAEPSALIQGIVLTTVCLAGIVILVWPNVLTLGKKTRCPPSA